MNNLVNISTEEAAQLCLDLRTLLLKGGFDLRKWRSSSTKVMDSIPEDLHEPSQLKALTDDDTNDSQKALGMHWNAAKDVLYVSVGNLTANQASTKRSLVSDITRTFDVLGWFAPSTILMKILFNICGK